MSLELRFVGENNPPYLAGHLFVALLAEYLDNPAFTAGDARQGMEHYMSTRDDEGIIVIPYVMTAGEIADIVASIAYIEGGADAFEKRNRLDEIYRVIMIGQHGNADVYNTPETMRARLNWSEPA